MVIVELLLVSDVDEMGSSVLKLYKYLKLKMGS